MSVPCEWERMHLWKRGKSNVIGFWGVYRNIPVVTRVYITACILLTLATNCDIISQYHIYLNPTLIVERHEYWRLLTSFLYIGPFGLGTAFNLLFTYRYSRILEKTSFIRSSADYCFMLIFMWFVILGLSTYFSEMLFLGGTFTHAILYIWCRRNPMQHVIIFGLLVLPADLVPLVLIGLSLMTGSPISSDLIAFATGHLFYVMNDVFPRHPKGFKILKTPYFLNVLFNEQEDVTTMEENQVGAEDNNMANVRMPAGPLVGEVMDNGNQFPLN